MPHVDVELDVVLHGLDGDGSAFCGGSGLALRPVPGVGWYDVPVSRRCRDCRLTLVGLGADPDDV